MYPLLKSMIGEAARSASYGSRLLPVDEMVKLPDSQATRPQQLVRIPLPLFRSMAAIPQGAVTSSLCERI